MKVLFAMGSEQKSKSVADRYYEKYGEIIEYEDVFYFKALIEKVKNNKTYDRIIINEDMEQFRANDIEQVDNYIFNTIDKVTDEAEDADIIFICSDRRTKGDKFITRLFNIGIYNLLVGGDRNINPLCEIIKKPKTKKEAKQYLNIDTLSFSDSAISSDDEVNELQMISILNFYEGIKNKSEKYLETFDRIAEQYSRKQLKIIAYKLPSDVLDVIKQADRYKFLFPDEEFRAQQQMQDASEYATKARSEYKPKKNNGGLFSVFKKQKADGQMKQQNVGVIKIDNSGAEAAGITIEDEETKRQKFEEEQRRMSEEARKQDELLARAKAEALEREKREKAAQIEAETRRQEELAAKARAEVEARKQEELMAKAKTEAIDREQAKLNNMPRTEKDFENIKQESQNNVIAEIEEKHKAELQNKSKNPEDLTEVKPNLNAPQRKTDVIVEPVRPVEPLRPVQPVIERTFSIDEEPIKPTNNAPSVGEGRLEEELRIKSEQEKLAMEQKKIREAQEKLEEQKKELREEQERIMSARNQLKTYSTDYSNTSVQYTNNINTQIAPVDYKKMIVLVGANKAGTTFVANAIAHTTSSFKILTSIIDMTRDKGMFYLYNRNDKGMRKIASECMQRVADGEDSYLYTDSEYLKVYTATPGAITDIRRSYKHKAIIDTVKANCNLTIVDADFTTPIDYFERANEIYIVQDLDVLKIQDVTLFLRELKNRGIDMNKIRVIINQYVKTAFTPKQVVGGLSNYNDPEMSFVDQLLPSKISYAIIPYNLNNYSKYIDCLYRGKVSYKGFSADFMQAIEELATMIYPRGANTKPSRKLFG